MSIFSQRSSFIWLVCIFLLAACGEAPSEQRTDAGQSVVQNSAVQSSTAQSSTTALDVYKSETCGCCQDWIDYMDEAGFHSTIHHPVDLNGVKAGLGVDARYQSCHTAVTEDGYVFEGHIPAKLVRQFLAEKPDDAIGLAVPGMPLGSPGMEVADRFTPYQVLLLKKDGSSEVYAQMNSAAEQH